MHIKDGEEVIIFKNSNGIYSIGMSRKDRNNQIYYGYFPCQFKKGVNVENKTIIKIKNAFLSFYLKEDKTMPYLMILDYIQVEKRENYAKLKGEETNESDLPF